MSLAQGGAWPTLAKELARRGGERRRAAATEYIAKRCVAMGRNLMSGVPKRRLMRSMPARQLGQDVPNRVAPVAPITHATSEATIHEASAMTIKHGFVRGEPQVIRIERS